MTTDKMKEVLDNIKDTLIPILNASGFPKYDDVIYDQEIKEAIRAINSCRRFTPTEDKLYDKKYEDLIVPLCVSAIAKMGAEGQTSHSENGIVRGYGSDGKYPSSILKSIKPLIK